MGTTSAGSIQLDLEVKSDLNDDINKQADKIVQKIRDGVKAMGGDLFKELRIGIDSSLSKMTETIKSNLDRAKEEMRGFVRDMEAMLRKSSGIQTPFDNTSDDASPTKVNAKANLTRGPPGVTIRKPKIKFDPQFDTAMFKQKYAELEAMMNVYDAKILAKQEERKKLLSESVLVSGSADTSALDKQVFDLDVQIAQLQDAAEKTSITLSAMDRQMNSAGSSAKGLSVRISEAIGSIGGLKGKIASASFSALSKGASMAGNGIAKASKAIGDFAQKAAKAGLNKLSNGFKNVGKQAASFAGKLLHVGKSSKSASNGMGRAYMGVGQLIKTFTIFSLVFPLVSKGIMAMGQNLIATLKTNSQFVSSLNTIRSNLATAFTPIIQAIMPALNALMSTLAKITGYIAAFVSLLFGKTYSATQQATQGIYDAKEAMGAYGDSASDAAKKAAEATKQLLGFDEITKLDAPDNSSNSGGGGSGGAPIFTPSDIDTSGISSIVDKIKDLFKNGKFEEIGKIIGESINKGVKKITSFISWDNVGSQVTAFVDGFTRIFNSTVATIDWYAIGRMFGTGINTIANTLYLLINGIDWVLLGSAFGKGLNGLVDTIDWKKFGFTLGSFVRSGIEGLYGFIISVNWASLGTALSNGVMGLIDSVDFPLFGKTLGLGIKGVFTTIHTFVEGIDWSKLGTTIGTSINNFFSNINWAEAGLTLSDAALGLLDTFREAIRTIDWEQIGTDISDFIINIDWWGVITGAIDVLCRAILGQRDVMIAAFKNIAGAMWDGLCQGITEFFADPGTFIKDNIVDPFVNWIKDLFGIHSPSTVMAEIGEYLIEGLQNGIENLIPNLLTNIGEWFGNIGKKISDTWEDVKKWTSETWKDVKTAVSDKVEDIKTKVSDGFKGAWKSVSEKCKDIKETVSTKFTEMTDWVGGIKDTLKEHASKAFTWFCDGVGSIDIKGAVEGAVNGATSWLSGLKDSAKTWGSDMMDGLSSGIKGAAEWVGDAVSGVADTIASWLHFSRPDVGPLHYYEEWMPDFMQGMAKGIESNTPGLISKVRNLAESMNVSMQKINEPTIAFAGEREFGVTHRLEDNASDKTSLADVIKELKEVKDELKGIKRSVDENGDTIVEIDGKQIAKVVKKEGKDDEFLK